jgi:NADH-quinone oxidoreductase subunit L
MVFAAGLGAYGAAMFHLFTHAFFKALLFLGAGSVIHALHDEQDLRRMGGMMKVIPFTFVFMMLGSIALAGLPPFAGYYSKDTILEAAFASHGAMAPFAFSIGILVAFMTAFYSWRLLVMTFHGKPRGDKHAFEHAHESPPIMLFPLAVLAIGAVVAGYLGVEYFVGEKRAEFWGASLFVLPKHDVLEHIHHVPMWVKKAPLIAGISGILLAYLLYGGAARIPAAIARAFSPLHKFLQNRWYIDSLYYYVFVVPALALGRLFWKGGDVAVVDRFGPNGVAWLTQRIAGASSRLQSGYVYHYAFAMLLALAAGLALLMGYGQ